MEKYKPGNLNKIIGQAGDKSNAKKLLTWINNWHRHRKLGTKPVSSCKYTIMVFPTFCLQSGGSTRHHSLYYCFSLKLDICLEPSECGVVLNMTLFTVHELCPLYIVASLYHFTMA